MIEEDNLSKIFDNCSEKFRQLFHDFWSAKNAQISADNLTKTDVSRQIVSGPSPKMHV